MNVPPLDEVYFRWLYSQVGSVNMRNRAKTYWSLLRLLHKQEFAWKKKIARDENRAQDGKDLRREFLEETGAEVDDPVWLDFDCSMLELLIALSRKLAFVDSSDPKQWFWELIDNLGLTECTDAYPPNPKIIKEILYKVIDRTYAPSGVGGLFPLREPDKDQRDVELWYQAQAYLLERL